jgi:hypothetical protein
MINRDDIHVGDKVHYIGHPGATPENGIVKEIPEHTLTEVRVVYHCANNWEEYMNYTSALTALDHLYPEWDDPTVGL